MTRGVTRDQVSLSDNGVKTIIIVVITAVRIVIKVARDSRERFLKMNSFEWSSNVGAVSEAIDMFNFQFLPQKLSGLTLLENWSVS